MALNSWRVGDAEARAEHREVFAGLHGAGLGDARVVRCVHDQGIVAAAVARRGENSRGAGGNLQSSLSRLAAARDCQRRAAQRHAIRDLEIDLPRRHVVERRGDSSHGHRHSSQRRRQRVRLRLLRGACEFLAENGDRFAGRDGVGEMVAGRVIHAQNQRHARGRSRRRSEIKHAGESGGGQP